MSNNTIQFIRSLESESDSQLLELEQYAKAHFVPIIKPGAKKLLEALVSIKQPHDILEVGTAIGYSALTMAALCPDAQIITLERNPVVIPVAIENMTKYAIDKSKIQLIQGEAIQYLQTLEADSVDFIFLDSAKAQYITFLPYLLKALRPDGVLVTDNVLQEGSIMKSRFAVSRRNRTIHQRLREYLYAITHHDALTTQIIPIDDGMAVSVKKGQIHE